MYSKYCSKKQIAFLLNSINDSPFHHSFTAFPLLSNFLPNSFHFVYYLSIPVESNAWVNSCPTTDPIAPNDNDLQYVSNFSTFLQWRMIIWEKEWLSQYSCWYYYPILFTPLSSLPISLLKNWYIAFNVCGYMYHLQIHISIFWKLPLLPYWFSEFPVYHLSIQTV